MWGGVIVIFVELVLWEAKKRTQIKPAAGTNLYEAPFSRRLDRESFH